MPRITITTTPTGNEIVPGSCIVIDDIDPDEYNLAEPIARQALLLEIEDAIARARVKEAKEEL